MKYLYSPSKNVFFISSMIESYDAGYVPDDLKEVSEDIFYKFIGTPQIGNERIAGDDGLPAWGKTPPLTSYQLLEQNEGKRQELLNAANIITADWRTELALDIISDSDKESLIRWLQYIKAVKSIDINSASGFEWPPVPQ